MSRATLAFTLHARTQYDVVFDTEDARQCIQAMFADLGVPCAFHLLRSHFRHKMCHIWAHLAKEAVNGGCGAQRGLLRHLNAPCHV